MKLIGKGLVLGSLLTLMAGCSGEMKTASGAYTSPAVAADEKAIAEEKRPDFSSPQVEDKSLVVEGLPEKLTWYTSKPGVWGSPRAKVGGTLRDQIFEFPETLRTVGPNANGYYRNYLNNSPDLVPLNGETKEFLPGLATHWAFGADKKTVYFKLNEKALWTDGTPVTSKDYVFSYAMMRSPHIVDPFYNDYYTKEIVDVKAYGDFVISSTSGTPLAPEDLLVSVSLGPRPSNYYGGEIKANWVDEYQWKFEPTAGPYYLSDFKKGESLTFTKVKNWWGYTYEHNKYRYNVETLMFQVITGGNDNIKNYFYKGELDFFDVTLPKEWEETDTREPYLKGQMDRMFQYFIPLTGMSGIFLNLKSAPFQDKRVRTALYYAVNAQKMIDSVFRGEFSRLHNIGLGHTFAGYDFDDNTIRKPDFDPKKAGELFDQAGYGSFDGDGFRKKANGERLSFELVYASPNYTERLSVIKEEAKKSGLDIQLKLMQEGAFTAVREKKFQAWYGGMSTSVYPDYWQSFHSVNAIQTQTNNFWSYANPEMDKLLDGFRVEESLAKKAELDKQIQRIVHEEALIVPISFIPFSRMISWKWVRLPSWLGQKFDSSFEGVFDPGFIWIDSDIKKEVLAAQKAGKAYESRTYINDLYKAK